MINNKVILTRNLLWISLAFFSCFSCSEEQKPLPFEGLITENRLAFIQKGRQVADNLNIPAEWLFLVMGNESAMNPKAINLVNRKAVGLLQFMPMTMKFLGTSRKALLKMSNVEQLEYVQRFFQAENLDYESYEDLYLYAFYPEALRKNFPDSYQFPKIVYEQNKIFDINQDGKLFLGEFRTFIRNKVPAEYRYVLIPEEQKTFEISFALLVFPCLLLLQIETFTFRVFKHSKQN